MWITTWSRTGGGHAKSACFRGHNRDPEVSHIKRPGRWCWFEVHRRRGQGQKCYEGAFLVCAEAYPPYLVGHLTASGKFTVSMDADAKFCEDHLVEDAGVLRHTRGSGGQAPTAPPANTSHEPVPIAVPPDAPTHHATTVLPHRCAAEKKHTVESKEKDRRSAGGRDGATQEDGEEQ